MIAFGVYSVIFSFQNTVYPLVEARGILTHIQATSDPQVIVTDLRTIQVLLPKSGNPVWVFPTDATDFAMMQKDLNTMAQNLGDSVFAPKYNDLNDQISNTHLQAQAIDYNLLDAIPYMYVSLSFVFAIFISIICSISFAETLKRIK
jgi:hypothetical protein